MSSYEWVPSPLQPSYYYVDYYDDDDVTDENMKKSGDNNSQFLLALALPGLIVLGFSG